MAAFFFGNSEGDLGPCDIEWDTATGGTNTDLGYFDSVSVKISAEKTDLKFAQSGTAPANRVVTGASMTIEAGLGKVTPERLEKLLQGFDALPNTAGTTVGYVWGPAIGQRDSDIWKQVTLTRSFSQVKSTNPMDAIDVFRCASEITMEVSYDAASQRFVKMKIVAYPSPDHLHPVTNVPLFFGGGIYA